MTKFIFIGIGGAVGALLRYFMSGWVHKFSGDGFPWGTLSINLLGSFVIGLLWGLFETVVVSQNIRLLLFIGVLGSFTTFSTFSLENFHLLRDSEYGFFALNVAASVIFGLTLTFAGYFLSRYIVNVVR